MEKRLIPGLGHRKLSLSLEYLVLPENKEVSKKKDGSLWKEHRSPPEGALMAKTGTS